MPNGKYQRKMAAEKGSVIFCMCNSSHSSTESQQPEGTRRGLHCTHLPSEALLLKSSVRRGPNMHILKYLELRTCYNSSLILYTTFIASSSSHDKLVIDDFLPV